MKKGIDREGIGSERDGDFEGEGGNAITRERREDF